MNDGIMQCIAQSPDALPGRCVDLKGSLEGMEQIVVHLSKQRKQLIELDQPVDPRRISAMLDVTDIPGVGLEDEVVLLGKQGDERITAEQLAQWCGTISYEIVSRVHPSLPRVVV